MNPELHWPVLVVLLLASGVSSAVLLRRWMARTCIACGHGPAMHRLGGCDGLIGDCAPCGCESFVPPASTRRPVAPGQPPRAARPIRKAS